jgi:hypothetical protein
MNIMMPVLGQAAHQAFREAVAGNDPLWLDT